MSVFSGLPLVIEPSDLKARLDAPELILVDLTSSARYDAGHIPGAPASGAGPAACQNRPASTVRRTGPQP
jgi:rhodanese-related sulfurtransferase